MISREDLLVFVDEALDGLVEIIEDLGDELACARPDLPGANSPYVVLTHCLGVMEYWGGHAIAGRPYHRDRTAEFVATGTVADLVSRTRRARAQLSADLADLQWAAPPRGEMDAWAFSHPTGRSQGGVLIHLYEELAQHRGQAEITRDVLRAPWARWA